MKRLLIAALIILLLAAVMYLHIKHLETLTEELIQQVETATRHIEQKEWRKAEKLAEEIMVQWEDHAFYLHITLRHSDIDAIRSSIKEMIAYLDSREDRAECLAVAARLINQLELLLEAEELTLKNIL